MEFFTIYKFTPVHMRHVHVMWNHHIFSFTTSRELWVWQNTASALFTWVGEITDRIYVYMIMKEKQFVQYLLYIKSRTTLFLFPFSYINPTNLFSPIIVYPVAVSKETSIVWALWFSQLNSKGYFSIHILAELRREKKKITRFNFKLSRSWMLLISCLAYLVC